MAQYGKNNYFDGVILPEPKEEMLRRMAKGVKLGYGEKNVYSPSFNGTILTSSPIQIGTSDFSIEYYGNAYGSGSGAPLLFNRANLGSVSTSTYFQVYGLNLGRNALNWVTFSVPDGGNITTYSLNFNYLAPDLSTKFHLVITRQGRMINVYIDNTLVASKEQTEIKDLGAFALVILNSSDVGFARVWNYALSAADVSALYNNGDPAGYVLPGTMKGLTPVEIVGKNSHTWTGVDAPVSFDIKINRVLSVGGAFRITGSVSNYKSGTPYLNLGHNSIAYLPKDNSPFTLVVTLKEGSSTLLSYIYIYGGSSSEDKQLTITIDSVELVGCVAEYLPQNLIPTAEGSVVQWLDSAPQLPEANGILPPLDASVGGYDLAAIGNPKIII
jgi:hypothetical protein